MSSVGRYPSQGATLQPQRSGRWSPNNLSTLTSSSPVEPPNTKISFDRVPRHAAWPYNRGDSSISCVVGILDQHNVSTFHANTSLKPGGSLFWIEAEILANPPITIRCLSTNTDWCSNRFGGCSPLHKPESSAQAPRTGSKDHTCPRTHSKPRPPASGPAPPMTIINPRAGLTVAGS